MEEISASIESLKRNMITAFSIDESIFIEEEAETKIIKTSEMTTNNLDPLEYFSRFLDIPEMIFHHLNGKELINISEVSPSYYNFIATSKVLMKKIKIVFDEKSVWKPEDYDLLKNSSRMFKNIEVRYVNDGNSRDYIDNEESKLDLWKWIKSIESSVEAVSFICKNKRSFIFDRSFLDFEQLEDLKFPKLKQLKLSLSGCSSLSDAFARLLINSYTIEKFEFEGGEKIVKDGVLTKMLENYDKLTSFKIMSGGTSHIFSNGTWKQFKFKLNSLKLVFQGCLRINDYSRNFLRSQSESLEELNIDVSCDEGTFKVVMKMPKLKSLCIQNCLLTKANFPNEVSTSITDLKMDYCYYCDNRSLLLKSMPNIRRLSVFAIDQEFLQTLLRMNRKFDELRYHRLSGIDQEALTEISNNVSKFPYSFFKDYPYFNRS